MKKTGEIRVEINESSLDSKAIEEAIRRKLELERTPIFADDRDTVYVVLKYEGGGKR